MNVLLRNGLKKAPLKLRELAKSLILTEGFVQAFTAAKGGDPSAASGRASEVNEWQRNTRERWRCQNKRLKCLGRHLRLRKRSAAQMLSVNPDKISSEERAAADFGHRNRSWHAKRD